MWSIKAKYRAARDGMMKIMLLIVFPEKKINQTIIRCPNLKYNMIKIIYMYIVYMYVGVVVVVNV